VKATEGLQPVRWAGVWGSRRGILPRMGAALEMARESAAPEAIREGVSGEAIEGRSLGRIAWIRLKRDKAAMAGGTVVALLVLVAIVGPYFVQDPNLYHANLINPTFSRPNGPFGGIPPAHPPPVAPPTAPHTLPPL